MYKIVNPPRHIPLANYDTEQQKYVDNLKSIPGISSICTFGSIGAPGLSDLDFLVVVDDNFESKNSLHLSCRRGLSILDGKPSLRNLRINPARYDKYLLLHGPAVVSRKLLSDLNFIIYAPYVETIFGKQIASQMYLPSKDIMAHLGLMYLIDFSFARMPQFEIAKTSGILDKRGWLTRTWSLTHSKAICDRVGIELSTEANTTLDLIADIRNDWVDSVDCPDTRFIKSFELSQQLLLEILTKALSKERSLLDGNQPEREQVFVGGDRRITCSEDIDVPSVTVSPSKYRFLGRRRWYSKFQMPRQFAYHLSGYGFKPQVDTVGQAVSAENDYFRLLSKRGQVAVEHRKYTYNMHLTFAMGSSLGLPVSPRSPIMKTLDNLHWRLSTQ